MWGFDQVANYNRLERLKLMLDKKLITKQYYDTQIKEDNFQHSFLCPQCERKVQVKMQIISNGVPCFVCEACDYNVDHIVLKDPLIFTPKNRVKFTIKKFITDRNKLVLKKYPSLLLHNEHFRIGLNLTQDDLTIIEAKLRLQEIM
jgi:hypothetical protein